MIDARRAEPLMAPTALATRLRLGKLRASGTAIAPGLAATIVVALAATYLADHYHTPPVIFALLLGMALNTLAAEPRYAPGIGLSARTLLRISVALLGLRITFSQVGELGWSSAVMVLTAVPLMISIPPPSTSVALATPPLLTIS